jgi:hypothetical protein
MLETSTLWKKKIPRTTSENCRNEGKIDPPSAQLYVTDHSYSLAQALQKSINRIGGVMDSALVSSVVDRAFEPCRVKPKIIKLVFVASPLST